jgi:hypothetical protein
MKKWILSLLVFLLSFSALALISFYAAIFLTGPHSDILAETIYLPVRLLLLLLVIGLPLWLAHKIFFRFKNR